VRPLGLHFKVESFPVSSLQSNKMSSPDNDEEDGEPPSESIYQDEDEPTFDASFLEANANLRRDEYESLKAIYANDDIEFKEWENRFGFRIRMEKMRLEIVTGPRYPLLETPLNICLSGVSISESVWITNALTDLADSKVGSIMLFDLIEEARALLPETEEEPEPLVEISIKESAHDLSPAKVELAVGQDVSDYMNGVTLQAISDLLKESGVTILGSENVLNSRLVRRFERMRTRLEKKYQGHHYYHKFLSTEIVFHGTQRKFIPNIITRGFVKPGDVMNKNGDRLQVRCGSTFGRGIYTSPSPRYSMSYTDVEPATRRGVPGQKIIVCAVLMGRRHSCSDNIYRLMDSATSGYDSHMSPSEYEYIVFNAAQLLPLYVLHVTNGVPNLESDWILRRRRGPPVKLKADVDVLEERQKTGVKEVDESETYLTQAMQRRILTNIARKHFPLGFGPAVGDKFVVEEIGAVDDDEEEWGEYQLYRKGFVRGGEGIFMDFDDDEIC